MKKGMFLAISLLLCSGTAMAFTDSRDGKTYKSVKIGEQTWMAENLNYQTASGSWCYEDDNSNCKKYGRLYNWNAAKSACPAGWHLPSREEWKVLVKTVGGDKAAAKKLKAKSGWKDNGNGTDNFGFSAQPSGCRQCYTSGFHTIGNYGYWWTDAEAGSGAVYHLEMGFGENYGVQEGLSAGTGLDWGLAVRCIQDKEQVVAQDDGLQMCTECKGSGKRICFLCNGKKTLTVSNGFVTMKMNCTGCNGTGHLMCDKCGGIGKISPVNQNQQTQQYNQYTPIDGKRMCPTCGGTGLCRICHGNHTTNCSYCNGVGKAWYGYGSNRRFETCAVCKGSGKSYCQCVSVFHNPGKCDICKGRRYID